jgi:phospholipase/carboxylesterase
MAHGTHDQMIPKARAQRAHDTLTGLNYKVEWHEYPMPHSVCMEEVADIAAWLGQVLGPRR